MSDDPSKEPFVTIEVQKELYEKQEIEVLIDAYLSIASIFSRAPALRVADGRPSQGAKTRERREGRISLCGVSLWLD
jgi:hypothetical protein